MSSNLTLSASSFGDMTDNAFHNYKSELESLETKYGWFREKRHSIYDLFVDGDLLKPLKSGLEFPNHLREQIATIRNWFDEMRAVEERKMIDSDGKEDSQRD